VEAATRAEHIFWWSLDITQTSQGWKVDRRVARQASEGEQQEVGFRDLTFENFDELADKCADVMDEFAKSAANFEFPS
jgi:hypothetical protein